MHQHTSSHLWLAVFEGGDGDRKGEEGQRGSLVARRRQDPCHYVGRPEHREIQHLARPETDILHHGITGPTSCPQQTKPRTGEVSLGLQFVPTCCAALQCFRVVSKRTAEHGRHESTKSARVGCDEPTYLPCESLMRAQQGKNNAGIYDTAVIYGKALWLKLKQCLTIASVDIPALRSCSMSLMLLAWRMASHRRAAGTPNGNAQRCVLPQISMAAT